jgi:hypothetical protein
VWSATSLAVTHGEAARASEIGGEELPRVGMASKRQEWAKSAVRFDIRHTQNRCQLLRRPRLLIGPMVTPSARPRSYRLQLGQRRLPRQLLQQGRMRPTRQLQHQILFT